MSLNYSNIIDKVELHEDYVRHIFRALFSVPNSTPNRLIERNKDYLNTVTEFLAGDLI